MAAKFAYVCTWHTIVEFRIASSLALNVYNDSLTMPETAALTISLKYQSGYLKINSEKSCRGASVQLEELFFWHGALSNSHARTTTRISRVPFESSPRHRLVRHTRRTLTGSVKANWYEDFFSPLLLFSQTFPFLLSPYWTPSKGGSSDRG